MLTFTGHLNLNWPHFSFEIVIADDDSIENEMTGLRKFAITDIIID